jgi:hypothetical protein
MSENKTVLREAENEVVVEGLLLELRHQEWKSKEGLNIEVDVEVAEGEVHTLHGMSKYKKKDGSENGIAKGYLTMIEEYKSVADVGREEADHVRITQGKIEVNEYFGQDEKLRSFPQLKTNFINRVKPGEEVEPKAEFEVEVYIKNVVEEKKDDEETGRAIVNAFIPLFGGKLVPFKFVVEDEGAVEYITDNYEPGSTVKVYGDIVNKVVVTKTFEEVGFGKPKEKIKRNTTREYVITGGSEAYDEDDKKAYASEVIKAALTEREVYLEGLKNKDKDGKKEEKKGGFDTKAKKDKKIKKDDLPF